VSDKEVGLSLLTHRPDPKDPGYFMLLLSPKVALPADKIIERDVVFVIDTSGSMAGVKFKQAMGALRYCVGRLNDRDRFNIVRFSSFAEAWKKDLVSAAEQRAAALTWIDTLMAEGGTDIYGALELAASFPRDPERPYFVIYMTDGKPTMGQTTDPAKILARAEQIRAAAGGESVRLFTWGVGYDVDTVLLDGMASACGGVSEYVRPEEDIEAKVSAFYNKASRPVLTNLDLKIEGDKVQLVNMYPKTLPDLYAGSQVVLFGRYTGDGAVALKLSGRVNRETQNFTFETSFVPGEKKHAFIEPLWAKRRIGHLLDLIRMHGQKQELVDDVVRLSVEYGIQTPYTSYLVQPSGGQLGFGERERQNALLATGVAPGKDVAAGGAPKAAAPPSPEAKKAEEALDKLARRSEPAAAPRPHDDRESHDEQRKELEKAKSLAEGFRQKDGKAAVDAAGYLRQLKEADSVGEKNSLGSFKKAGGTRFFEYRGMWVDERFQADAAMTMVKFGSAAYFRLIELHPELVEVFKIGDSIVYVTAAGKAIAVAATGEETLTDAQIAELFTAAKK
jgi:Ca-activated chloride channel family protein